MDHLPHMLTLAEGAPVFANNFLVGETFSKLKVHLSGPMDYVDTHVSVFMRPRLSSFH
jgi:hypothetical protein